MSFVNKPASISTDTPFSEVLNETCERLRDKQVQYSIRRIHEMEELLNTLEQELDQFFAAKAGV